MNIQRKYSLPNCTLLLEGLSDASRTAHLQDLRPILSILVNTECYISGYGQPLVGGRDFFESLVRAVSGYAQEFLSNVSNPQAHNYESELVYFQRIDNDCHRLIVNPDNNTEAFGANNNKEPIELDLNTLQLFDLVEAIDQFFADSQTLPELSLGLQPVSRSHGVASAALAKQAVPASVGVGSLAAAALVLGFLPVPQVRTPEKLQEQTNRTEQTSPSPNATASPTPEPIQTTTPITGATPTPTTTPITEATPTPTATPIAATPTPTTVPTPGATPATADLESLLSTVPEITDPSQLKSLNRQVYNVVNGNWNVNTRSQLPEDLVYRIGVAADGSIVGYKSVNSKASDAVAKTPLPTLLYNPSARGPINKEPIAQFKVVFTREGILQVSPWRGYSATPDVVGPKITDATSVKTLNQKLVDTIRQNSQATTPGFKSDLKYRVAVNKDGVIADYEPLNGAAFDHFRETPLPKLFTANANTGGSNIAAANTKEPLAHFEVTFKPDGNLEITPWEGYR
ncbi:MAG: DUF4335 domain-containing protein [Scytonematopsis contorta HA4267-MV1]|jgi:hypothetical protein|nr:DUF4335 domain-containing protein [Scytonematopsis contorta HA4267-MV1]